MDPCILPCDVTRYIFRLLSSKERANVCRVSSKWNEMSVKFSSELSTVGELYYLPQFARPKKALRRRVTMDDYHLIVRLKCKSVLKIKDVCKGITEQNLQDRLDVLSLIWQHKIYPDEDHKITTAFKTACKSGYVDMVLSFIKSDLLLGYDMEEHVAMTSACKKGHNNVVMVLNDDVFDKSLTTPDVFVCLSAAYKNNHISTAEIIIKKYHPKITTIRSALLYGACAGGHLDLIANMKASVYHYNLMELNWGLEIACKRGQQKSVAEMYRRGAAICRNCKRTKAEHLSMI